MKFLAWALAWVAFATCASVLADDTVAIPAEYEDSSIEVGFMVDNEPEPHLLVESKEGKVQLYELPEQGKLGGRSLASIKIEKPVRPDPKPMASETYFKRLRQVVDDDSFFTHREVKRKKRCQDQYVLRVRVGDRQRERRGCAYQNNDPFASFAQLMFRDAFLASRAK